MRLAGVVLLAACQSSAPPATPVGNAPPPEQASSTKPQQAKRDACSRVAADRTSPTSLTTGAIAGVICDDKTGEILAGVAVVAWSPSLRQGPQTVLTNELGRFEVLGLPPDRYTLTLYFLDTAEELPKIAVEVNQVAWVNHVLVQRPQLEVIRIGP